MHCNVLSLPDPLRPSDHARCAPQLDDSLLPSPEEVYEDPGRVFLDCRVKTVKLLSSGQIVKYGFASNVGRAEGLAMQFARDHGIAEAPEVSPPLSLSRDRFGCS